MEKLCLASPGFEDTRQGKDDSILAGYGRYHRSGGEGAAVCPRSGGKTCETNKGGPMKFHYCDKVRHGGRMT